MGDSHDPPSAIYPLGSYDFAAPPNTTSRVEQHEDVVPPPSQRGEQQDPRTPALGDTGHTHSYPTHIEGPLQRVVSSPSEVASGWGRSTDRGSLQSFAEQGYGTLYEPELAAPSRVPSTLTSGSISPRRHPPLPVSLPVSPSHLAPPDVNWRVDPLYQNQSMSDDSVIQPKREQAPAATYPDLRSTAAVYGAPEYRQQFAPNSTDLRQYPSQHSQATQDGTGTTPAPQPLRHTTFFSPEPSLDPPQPAWPVVRAQTQVDIPLAVEPTIQRTPTSNSFHGSMDSSVSTAVAVQSSGLSTPISRLVLNGITCAASNKVAGAGHFDSSVQTILACLPNIANKVDKIMTLVPDVSGQVANIRQAYVTAEVDDRRRETVLAVQQHYSTCQLALVNISLQLQHLIASSSTEAISIEVIQAAPDPVNPGRTYKETTRAQFGRRDARLQIIHKVAKLENDTHIFSAVQGHSEDRLVVQIEAWAPDENNLKRLAATTGSLYYFGSLFSSFIADQRGCYLQLRDGGTGGLKGQTIKSNSCILYLGYNWPSPEKLSVFQNLMGEVKNGNRNAVSLLNQAAEKTKEEKHRAKNIYLVGLTGEGKSTMANALVGTDIFSVSDAGTGTFDIMGDIVQTNGLIRSKDQVVVWDTPGMNDQGGLDSIFANKMYRHLTREQTVACIFLISKDGSRFPMALKEMFQIYRKAFGESFIQCVNVLIGVNLKELHKDQMQIKQRFWVTSVSKELGYQFPMQRIFFFDPRSKDHQPELDRINFLVEHSENQLTGTGSTIFQGLLDIRNEQDPNRIEAKKIQMMHARNEVLDSLVDDINAQNHVRFYFDYNTNSCRIFFLSNAAHMKRFLLKVFDNGKKGRDTYDQRDTAKEWKIMASGPISTQVLSSVGNPMTNHSDKDRVQALFHFIQRYRITLVPLQTSTEHIGGRRRQITYYTIVDLDGVLQDDIYVQIEAIIGGMVQKIQSAETFIDALHSMLMKNPQYQ